MKNESCNYYKKYNNRKLFNHKNIMLIILALLFLFSITFLFIKNVNAETSPEYDKIYVSVMINEGDTLSLYAEKYAYSPEYFNTYIDETCYINNLKNDTLLAGSYLLIPIYVEHSSYVSN